MYLPGQEFNFRYYSLRARKDYILPTIELRFERSSKPRNDNLVKSVIISNINLQIAVGKETERCIINSETKTDSLQYEWKSDNESSVTFYITLDNFTLSRIEKIRKDDNLYLMIDIKFLAHPASEIISIKQYSIPTINIEVPKSKWIEEILQNLNYKNVAIIEMPKLEHEELNDSIDDLNKAWKNYSTGDMDEVLVDCRKALEGISKSIKDAGFKKEDTDDNGKPITVPNWKEFLDSDSKGEILKTINKKVFGLVAPGSHIGTILDMNHANFVLLQTYSLAHLVISRFKILKTINK